MTFWIYIQINFCKGLIQEMPAHVAIDNNTVYKLGGFRVDRDIVRYIREASDISGISFDYMMAKAGHESRFEADAAASRSSAEGIYQFTADTWLQQMKLHGQVRLCEACGENIPRQPRALSRDGQEYACGNFGTAPFAQNSRAVGGRVCQKQ